MCGALLKNPLSGIGMASKVAQSPVGGIGLTKTLVKNLRPKKKASSSTPQGTVLGQ